jgi:hypothetical protein
MLKGYLVSCFGCEIRGEASPIVKDYFVTFFNREIRGRRQAGKPAHFTIEEGY